MLIYLDDYRNRRIARAPAAAAQATVCAGISMLEIRAAGPAFQLREALRQVAENVPACALDRICALASRI